MTRMVPDAALLLDQLGDPTGGPQAVAVAQGLRATFQPPFHPPSIRFAQAGLASCPSHLLQTGHASFSQLLSPAAHRLTVDLDLAGHLGLAQPLTQEPRRFQSPLFQSFKIASHAFGVSHAASIPQKRQNVTILYGSQ